MRLPRDLEHHELELRSLASTGTAISTHQPKRPIEKTILGGRTAELQEAPWGLPVTSAESVQIKDLEVIP